MSDEKSLENAFNVACQQYREILDNCYVEFVNQQTNITGYIRMFEKKFLESLANHHLCDMYTYDNDDNNMYVYITRQSDQISSILRTLYPHSKFKFIRIPQYDSCDFAITYELNRDDFNSKEIEATQKRLDEEQTLRRRRNEVIRAAEEHLKKLKESPN